MTTATQTVVATLVVLLLLGCFALMLRSSIEERIDPSPTMPEDITINQEPHSSDEAPSAEFFTEVRDGRDERTRVSGGYGSYPHIYKVDLDDLGVFYGFRTGLPEDREPWFAGFKSFSRDTVLDAETLEEVDGSRKAVVNALLDAEVDI